MTVNRAVALAVTFAFAGGLVWASHAPLALNGRNTAVLRLAWSARPERIETCRTQTEEELARLPVHMRQPVICEGSSAEYRLTVRRDGRDLLDQVIRGGGFRHDRRLFVFQEFPFEAGDVSVDITFERLGPPTGEEPGEGVPATAAAQSVPAVAGETVPARLAYSERLQLIPGEVVLVTYSPETRELTAVRAGR